MKGGYLLLDSINNEVLSNLTKSELSILQYIDNNASKVLSMSIHELSENVFSSTATILRLCKKLNFSGYSELKFVLKNNLASKKTLNSNPLSDDNILLDLYSQVENTGRLLNTKNIESVISYLLSDKKIHLFSTGITNVISEYMQRYLLAVDRSVILYKIDKLSLDSTINFTKNDVLILVSVTGNEPSILKIARLAQSNNVPIIAIAPLTSSPLSQIANITLYFYSKERSFSNYDISNRISIFYIVDMLLEYYFYHLSNSKNNNNV